jgi:Tol biopolymer transport system component
VRRLAAILGLVLVVLPSAGTAGGATGFRDSLPVFSPDGRSVAFIRVAAPDEAIMLVGSDGRGLRALVHVWASGLTWSPDGRWLAYEAGGNIWRIEVATGVIDRLTTDGPAAWQPDWSPDGTMIAYSRFEPDSARCSRCTDIWVMNADGTDQRRLAPGRRPVFSPDGTRVAISGGQVLAVDLTGDSAVPGSGSYVTWSPRGTYVAYTLDGLWIENLETGVLRRVSKYLGQKPSWSPDGKVIAGGAGLSASLALIRAKDGSHFTKLRDSDIDGGLPSWSPQGLVAYTHAHGCGIDVAREDGTHVRRLTRAC